MLKVAGPDSRTRSLPVAFRPELVKVNVFTADCPGPTGPKTKLTKSIGILANPFGNPQEGVRRSPAAAF